MNHMQVALTDDLPAVCRATPTKLLHDLSASIFATALNRIVLAEAHRGGASVAAQTYAGRGCLYVNQVSTTKNAGLLGADGFARHVARQIEGVDRLVVEVHLPWYIARIRRRNPFVEGGVERRRRVAFLRIRRGLGAGRAALARTGGACRVGIFLRRLQTRITRSLFRAANGL